jgi:hypothetical protein
MTDRVIVHKNRTNKLTVNLGMDITGDTITSEVRTQEDPESDLLMAWIVTVIDAPTGELEILVDDATTAQIEVDRGYMDFKRVSSGEPLPVMDKPLEVEFRNTVTA